MCGIAGIVRVGSAVTLSQLTAMSDPLRHRGPDDQGAEVLPQVRGLSCGLAHRRLSILDLSAAGRNPMADPLRGSWISYNGEVYNFPEVRAELAALGEEFVSRTDTEVVLKACGRWGPEALGRLAGMFAFAIWDGRSGRLLLARDRLGKKPLYWFFDGETFAFASELKGLLPAFPGPREIDPEALSDYLQLGYVPEPRTIFKGIRKLRPAEHLVFDGREPVTKRYWEPVEIAARPPREAAPTDSGRDEQLEELLKQAVRGRLLSDVPLGAFLSGGIDSSLVVALMREVSGGAPVRTFTIGFDDRRYDESPRAAAVAAHLGTIHRELRCSPSDALALVPSLAEIFDEPFADSSALPTLLVSRLARQEVAVALAGDGGDELFHGYDRHRAALALARVAHAVPRPLREVAARGIAAIATRRSGKLARALSAGEPDEVYEALVGLRTRAEASSLTGREATRPLAEAWRRVLSAREPERIPLVDLLTYLPGDLLTKVDRASMAVSLEVRAPLLDHRVAEYVLSLPLAAKRKGNRTKVALRAILATHVPEALTDGPKRGFGVPIGEWLRRELRDLVESSLSAPTMAALGLDPSAVRGLKEQHLSGAYDHTDALWSLVALGEWHCRWGRAA